MAKYVRLLEAAGFPANKRLLQTSSSFCCLRNISARYRRRGLQAPPLLFEALPARVFISLSPLPLYFPFLFCYQGWYRSRGGDCWRCRQSAARHRVRLNTARSPVWPLCALRRWKHCYYYRYCYTGHATLSFIISLTHTHTHTQAWWII